MSGDVVRAQKSLDALSHSLDIWESHTTLGSMVGVPVATAPFVAAVATVGSIPSPVFISTD